MSEEMYEKDEVEMSAKDRYDRDERDNADANKDGSRAGARTFYRKKVCRFCTGKKKVDYKDVEMLKRLTTEKGKILPRHVTGNCAKDQRNIAKAIKRARAAGLMPFVID